MGYRGQALGGRGTLASAVGAEPVPVLQTKCVNDVAVDGFPHSVTGVLNSGCCAPVGIYSVTYTPSAYTHTPSHGYERTPINNRLRIRGIRAIDTPVLT